MAYLLPAPNEPYWRVEFTEPNGAAWSGLRAHDTLREAYGHAAKYAIADDAAKPRVYYGPKRPDRRPS